MKNIESKSNSANATQRHEARSFAHHYGAVKRHGAPERTLPVYAPLGWGVGQVLPHVRRAVRASAQRLDAAHLVRTPLAL